MRPKRSKTQSPESWRRPPPPSQCTPPRGFPADSESSAWCKPAFVSSSRPSMERERLWQANSVTMQLYGGTWEQIQRNKLRWYPQRLSGFHLSVDLASIVATCKRPKSPKTYIGKNPHSCTHTYCIHIQWGLECFPSKWKWEVKLSDFPCHSVKLRSFGSQLLELPVEISTQLLIW